MRSTVATWGHPHYDATTVVWHTESRSGWGAEGANIAQERLFSAHSVKPARESSDVCVSSGKFAQSGSPGLLVSPLEFNVYVPPLAGRRYALDCGVRSKIARL